MIDQDPFQLFNSTDAESHELKGLLSVYIPND